MKRRAPLLKIPQAMGEMRADYAAMRPSRFRRQRQGMGGTADAHYASDARFCEMREYSRDMDRNDAIIGQAVDRACDNLCQTGFRLEVQTGDAELNDELWQRFQDWGSDADAADVQGEWTFRDYEWKAKRAEFIDGDIFVLLTDEGRMEAVEACRCRTPRSTQRNVVHGVLLDERRKRLEYWFTRDLIDPGQRVARVSDMVRYSVRDGDEGRQVCHIYQPTRFSQTRGVTVFAPVFDMAGMVEDVQFAKLVQQQMSSVFAAFLERTADYKLGSRTQEDLDDGTAADIEDLTPGLFLKGRIGEKLTMPASNIPNAEYLPHLRSLIMMIGLRLHLPICVTLLDPSDTNFSGYRGAIDQARMSFRRAQAYYARRFHSPVYLWKVRQWLREDAALRAVAVKLGPKIFKHRWDAPGWPYIEPMKDAEADAFRLKNLLVSPRALQSERGRDWDDVYAETVEDNTKAILSAIAAAAAIEKQTGAAVSWREVLNWSSPDGAPKKDGSEGGAGAAGAGKAKAAAAPGDAEAARTEFLRKVTLAFISDGTVSDVIANATQITDLMRQAGLPVNPDYKEPWLPVKDDSGRLVSGEAIMDKEGDVVGGAVLPPEAGAPGDGTPAAGGDDPAGPGNVVEPLKPGVDEEKDKPAEGDEGKGEEAEEA